MEMTLERITVSLSPAQGLKSIGDISCCVLQKGASPVIVKRECSRDLPTRQNVFLTSAPDEYASENTQIHGKYSPDNWSLDLLQSLEWKRFETLCLEYFRVLGKEAVTVSQGADRGIFARIFREDSDYPEYEVQCQSGIGLVEVNQIKELFGVMVREFSGKGIFMAASSFSEEAKKFSADHKSMIFLIDGNKFLSMLSKLLEEKQHLLFNLATEGDYITPTCVTCGIKLIRKTWRNGEFWGCKNYPNCRFTLKI